MDFKRLLGIIIGFVIIASLIFGLVMFVRSRFFPARPVTVTTNTPTSTNNSLQPMPATQSAETVMTGNGAPGITNGSMKTHQVNNVNFSYPQNWGLLTCTNSSNFEFDPNSSADQKVSCDVARLPITMVVGSTQGCNGELVDLGNTRVQRTKMNNARGTDYRWCFNVNGTAYNLTHRVSQGEARGTSKTDFSQQIEQMIARIARP